MKQIKIIIRDGIVEGALAEIGGEPVEVEILDICKDYGDYEWLDTYSVELYDDPRYKKIPFTVSHGSEGNDPHDPQAP